MHPSKSLAQLATLQSWVELRTPLERPSPPSDFLSSPDRARELEAIHLALHSPAHARSVPASSPTAKPEPAASPSDRQRRGSAAAATVAPGARPADAAASCAASRGSSAQPRRRGRMEEALGSQIATSAVPGSRSFNRVPSGVGGGASEVTWDEMGQLGLHKALNEYYKLSASQRRMQLCGRGAPSVLCKIVHTLVVPQLPAFLAPPALFAAAGWLLFAAAWLLYASAPLTIPLALWLAFAADGSLSLAPAAAASLSRLHPAAGSALERLAELALPLPAQLGGSTASAGHLATALCLLGGLLLLLRLAERVVLASRGARLEAAGRTVTAAQVQAAYAGWAPPGGQADPPAGALAARQGGAAAQQAKQQQQRGREGQPGGGDGQPQPSPGLLAVLQGEVQTLWQSVFDGEGLPAHKLASYDDVAAAVNHLAKETGVDLKGAGRLANGGIDRGRQLLDAVLQIKHAVGVA